MKIIPDNDQIGHVSKTEIEQVQQEQTEYTLLGTFLRTPGLKLYYYNNIEEKVIEATIQYESTINIVHDGDQVVAEPADNDKCSIDSRFEYFEALNQKSAERRVQKYKAGMVKSLCNLRRPGTLSFY